ncbi:MAG: hypothetical protein J0H12_06680 [Candidatus Paracaedimonas acanthamoebae]|uniref:Uncharacterized protein n=1 Tax=Candidatus Paracaedimonas acanthamoebae TaxID=244581 RepID=A0A8J7PMZ4_9PROT|nr:hypothetical protein [Holosporales bacterium]MBN9413588.1 hypothetical protein [Candidatus Paracaedimonas acanthamoebae]OJX02561.1 MAG: hypothetical protein BGO76_06715 [Caedibacter sp. 38-128]
MNLSQNKFEKLNQLIQTALNSSNDPTTKALAIARASGAFKQRNVIFVHNKLYSIDPYNPHYSLLYLRSLNLQKID